MYYFLDDLCSYVLAIGKFGPSVKVIVSFWISINILHLRTQSCKVKPELIQEKITNNQKDLFVSFNQNNLVVSTSKFRL